MWNVCSNVHAPTYTCTSWITRGKHVRNVTFGRLGTKSGSRSVAAAAAVAFNGTRVFIPGAFGARCVSEPGKVMQNVRVAWNTAHAPAFPWANVRGSHYVGQLCLSPRAPHPPGRVLLPELKNIRGFQRLWVLEVQKRMKGPCDFENGFITFY